jgi:phosphoribulokinase
MRRAIDTILGLGAIVALLWLCWEAYPERLREHSRVTVNDSAKQRGADYLESLPDGETKQEAQP